MPQAFFSLSRLFAIIAISVAMASSGFAHRIAPQDVDPDLIAFVQAGGSLQDLCAERDDAGFGGAQSCEACRLYATALVPPAASVCLTDLEGGKTAQLIVPIDNQSAFEIDPSRPARAPPVA